MSLKIFVLFSLFYLAPLFSNDTLLKKYDQENSAPEVRIIEPIDQSEFKWNSLVSFTISVIDQEDGISEYNEITENEVILEVAYMPEAVVPSKDFKDQSRLDRQMLSMMSRSNCLNCHAAQTKIIGPSFQLVAERYAEQPGAAKLLADKLIAGSTGVWGDEPMPAHPDIKIENAQLMVEWILKKCVNSNYRFYVGTKGAFKTKEKTDAGGQYILTASYQDHGAPGMPNSSKWGTHTIFLAGK
jgi:cytochrome c